MKTYKKKLLTTNDLSVYNYILNKLNNINKQEYKKLVVNSGDVMYYMQECANYFDELGVEDDIDLVNDFTDEYVKFRNMIYDEFSPDINAEVLMYFLAMHPRGSEQPIKVDITNLVKYYNN